MPKLDGRANRLANYLRKLGVGRGVFVGLCLERSIDMITALLAILKAGGVYVPLDANYPRERLRFMVEDTRTPVLLTERGLSDRLSSLREGTRLVLMDEEEPVISLESDERPDIRANAADLAYVMYTSGSTGRPKGVMIPHRAVVRLVRNTNYCRFDRDQVFLQLAPVSFDASTLEIWGPLLNGGRLAIMPPGTPSLDDLAGAIEQFGVSTLWLTAGLFQVMVDQRPEALRPLSQLLAGGDVLSPAHVRKAVAQLRPGATLINGYGPTESTTFACCHVMGAGEQVGDSVPIGRPISNTRVYLLDPQLEPVSIGSPGELCIGGAGLAAGYLNNPELTAEKFISDPFSGEPGARLYRTGDLARYRSDGTLEFLGRIDNQVKVLGHRIELAEIESVLGHHPAVRQTVVVARADRPGEKHLVAYVVPAAAAAISAPELREFLRSRVPDYMVPSAFIVLESFPLSPNGKVERAALPAPEAASSPAPQPTAPPRTAIEQKIEVVWRKILGRERVGLEENFFDAGGDSLQLIEAHSELEKTLTTKISITDLFAHTTISSLAWHISHQENETAAFAKIRDRARKQKEGLARQKQMRMGAGQ